MSGKEVVERYMKKNLYAFLTNPQELIRLIDEAIGIEKMVTEYKLIGELNK